MTDKSRDELTRTTDEGKIELKEGELNRVAGGTATGTKDKKPVEYIKYNIG